MDSNIIPFWQVDAFAETLFTGNPAGVCILDAWPGDSLMQSIAFENNLAETAFVVPRGDGYGLRWFTPAVEVDLCGHATLASAFVLFDRKKIPGDEVVFHSPRSGILKVRREGEMLFLDFPADTTTRMEIPGGIMEAIGVQPLEMYRGKTDFMAVLRSEAEVLAVKPGFQAIAALGGRGLIITSPGEHCDFVSRFFAPQSGVDEDPVTGSAHTTLTPFWAGRLGKEVLTARQISKRGGTLHCRNVPPRVIIGGKGRLYLEGGLVLGQ